LPARWTSLPRSADLADGFANRDFAWNRGDIWVVIVCAAWEFVYFAYCWAASGRTAGMALLSVRVAGDDGSDASGAGRSSARWLCR